MAALFLWTRIFLPSVELTITLNDGIQARADFFATTRSQYNTARKVYLTPKSGIRKRH
jgi:hypothetical protein